MQDRLLIAGTAGMFAAVVLLLAGAIPVDQGRQTVIFQTPAFLAGAAAGAGLLLAACFLRRPPLRQVAFVLAHAGLVLILSGAWLDRRGGQRLDGVRLPVGMGHAIGTLRDAGGRPVALGFTLEVLDFSVSFYDPVYVLFRPDESVPGGFAPGRKIDPRVPASLRQVPGGPLTADQLKAGGEWRTEVPLAGGGFLRMQPAVPRWYEAGVRTACGDETRRHVLAVNHPLLVNGWQVLLVSYGTEPMGYVELAFKRSPGIRLVVAGIWCVIAGVALLCLVLPLLRRNPHAGS